MSFYSIAGTQLHWRNAAFVSGEPSHVLSNDSIELSHQLTFGQGDFVDRLFKSPGWKFVVVLFSSLMVYEIVLFIILPPEPTFIFMSWAVLALPVIDVHASSALGVLHPIFGAGPLPWLPNGTTLQGFEDWHISLIKLESTRKDVFPFKKDGYIWKKLAETFRDERIPEHALERLHTRHTDPNSEPHDGFHHLNKTPRGSISFDNAFTTASYTRKCFTGTLCGVTPLVADFNVEFKNHLYQPCFPQICNAFNKSYVDRWMNKILGILDEQRVANETLVVAVRDHGLSIAENHGVTAYLNPNVANFHVPLVLSHPQLPTLHSNAAVQSLQILPTILDLLLETRSLPDEALQAATDLLGLYEGQSLIRLTHTESRKTGQPNWQFTVMNPGKATLGVRSARDPAWRLVVPLVEDMEWRFTNLENFPNETEEIVDFGYTSFLGTIEEIHGKGAAVWAEEAAFLARWWVDENRRRYRYTE
ncbi:subtilase-like protein [Beauveria bassiana ARSEF 2860]|uniref:Subtilase-like protein n=1 Tax=Beauveria bassiana (strain ARSEF 2860) TaxID=655819 RepID=J4UHT2_BEAB2|nr:subtilase-like protein [Beauveria bassiana ARSEF 2860]EJP62857.1 subtilase-like protein [Beauveria bassiana ARSEF 2860]